MRYAVHMKRDVEMTVCGQFIASPSGVLSVHDDIEKVTCKRCRYSHAVAEEKRRSKMREGKSLDKDLPPNAKTIELDEKEVLEALTAYICERDGPSPGGSDDLISQLEVIVFPNKKMRYLITYWPTN